MPDPDAHLLAMDRALRVAAARAVRAAIRGQGRATGRDPCRRHPAMGARLPDAPAGGQAVPGWAFTRGRIASGAARDRGGRTAPRSDRDFGR